MAATVKSGRGLRPSQYCLRVHHPLRGCDVRMAHGDILSVHGHQPTTQDMEAGNHYGNFIPLCATETPEMSAPIQSRACDQPATPTVASQPPPWLLHRQPNALLTDDIEAWKKFGIVLLDLTTACDTVWLHWLHLQLLRMVPGSHLVTFIAELPTNHSIKLRTNDCQVSHLRHLHNAVPQGSTLSPMLLNIYISNISQTTSQQYSYANDLALLSTGNNWGSMEHTLSRT